MLVTITVGVCCTVWAEVSQGQSTVYCHLFWGFSFVKVRKFQKCSHKGKHNGSKTRNQTILHSEGFYFRSFLYLPVILLHPSVFLIVSFFPFFVFLSFFLSFFLSLSLFLSFFLPFFFLSYLLAFCLNLSLIVLYFMSGWGGTQILAQTLKSKIYCLRFKTCVDEISRKPTLDKDTVSERLHAISCSCGYGTITIAITVGLPNGAITIYEPSECTTLKFDVGAGQL